MAFCQFRGRGVSGQQIAGFLVWTSEWGGQEGAEELVDGLVEVGSAWRGVYRCIDNVSIPVRGRITRAEVDILGRSLGGAAVLGVEDSSLPCLHDQISCDFHNEDKYSTTVFELILALYQIAPNDPAVADLRESLWGAGLR